MQFVWRKTEATHITLPPVCMLPVEQFYSHSAKDHKHMLVCETPQTRGCVVMVDNCA